MSSCTINQSIPYFVSQRADIIPILITLMRVTVGPFSKQKTNNDCATGLRLRRTPAHRIQFLIPPCSSDRQREKKPTPLIEDERTCRGTEKIWRATETRNGRKNHASGEINHRNNAAPLRMTIVAQNASSKRTHNFTIAQEQRKVSKINKGYKFRR